jgi:rubrerythrin
MTLSTEALDYLSRGIISEIAAYIFYKTSARNLSEKKLVEIMHHFAEEERKHFLTLEHHYDQHVRSEKWVTYRDIMNQDGLPEIDEDMGERHVKRLGLVKGATEIMDILELALELEQEAYNLYKEGAEKSDDADLRKTFEYLAQFELGHITNVEQMMAEWKK